MKNKVISIFEVQDLCWGQPCLPEGLNILEEDSGPKLSRTCFLYILFNYWLSNQWSCFYQVCFKSQFPISVFKFPPVNFHFDQEDLFSIFLLSLKQLSKVSFTSEWTPKTSKKNFTFHTAFSLIILHPTRSIFILPYVTINWDSFWVCSMIYSCTLGILRAVFCWLATSLHFLLLNILTW